MCYNGQEKNDFIRSLTDSPSLSLKILCFSMVTLSVNSSKIFRQGWPMITQQVIPESPCTYPSVKELVKKTPGRGKTFLKSLSKIATSSKRYE